MFVVAVEEELGAVEIDVAETRPGCEPRPYFQNGNPETHRLLLRAGLRVVREDPHLPNLWWTGEGWVDHRSAPTGKGPLAQLMSEGQRDTRHPFVPEP